MPPADAGLRKNCLAVLDDRQRYLDTTSMTVEQIRDALKRTS